MKKYGFSLIEILVALCLITTSSLLLLKQQWHAIQWANEQLLLWQANHHLINACERQKAGLPRQTLAPPFFWLDSEDMHIKWRIHQQNNEHWINCSY